MIRLLHPGSLAARYNATIRTSHLPLSKSSRNAHIFVVARVNGTGLYSTRSIRHHSTRQATREIARPSDQPFPISPCAESRRKVELRPGPVKSKPAAADSVAHSSTGHVEDSTNVSKPPPSEETPNSSLFEVAKQDVDHASKHGILAPPPADAGFVMRTFHQIKELFKFYLAGVKLIFAHRKEVQRIHERVQSGGAPLSRSENRFINTHASDMKKLVPFLLLVLIAEELIPLVVLYAPGFLPSTCILPSQRDRILQKLRERQIEASQKGTSVFSGIMDASLEHLSAPQAEILCGLLGLPQWGLLLQKRGRLDKHLKTLSVDDQLLIAEKRGESLTDAQVVEALWERGFVADKFIAKDARHQLTNWLDSLQQSSTPPTQTQQLQHIIRSCIA